jgi:REP element-mobilizing transposase RayT
MANAYTIHNQEGTYFVTFTVHQWVDVFSRNAYADILLENLRYCQQNKEFKIYAWVIMTNHCHLIVRSEGFKLSDVIRDFKKHTSKKLIEAIENSETESRKRWLLWLLKKDEMKWFWEEGYHGEEIESRLFFNTKVRYIHLNPVMAGIVEKEEEYLLSSCGDFYGTRKGLLKLEPF